MSVSYNTTIGYGFRVSEKRLKKIKVEGVNVKEDGLGEALDTLLPKEYPLLDYAWAGNAYTGYEGGFIVVVKSSSRSVYGYQIERIDAGTRTEAELDQLMAAFERFGKQKSGIGAFVASSVG